MNLKEFKNKPAYKVATNTYVLIATVFIIWMLFFDENSYLAHKELNDELDELKTWVQHHEKEIARDKKTIKKLEDSLELERYAREKYLMKKENEDVFIIEFDTVK